MSKDEAVLVLLDRTQKYFISVILIAGIGFGLLFLISYIVDVIKKRKIRWENEKRQNNKWYK